MNRTAFKSGLVWVNIGEISVVSGTIGRSVYNSALFEPIITRQHVHLSLFK